ncbi:MAG: hypothetical protein IPK19_42150 [Chloroflexi bacterium]|nr:hypothetical protein [Chloroflexota bacterium]
MLFSFTPQYARAGAVESLLADGQYSYAIQDLLERQTLNPNMGRVDELVKEIQPTTLYYNPRNQNRLFLQQTLQGMLRKLKLSKD